ncbi:ROK family glucokinase [Nocardioides acrostichi]|uniref:Glucokinase n=1 Tax=Nocardioides acrostichi TaxID=2784339 RepID=A0A930UUS2_9ACTN|nr:ROK family glucokinase [Nocardioides acrostichi]MBF4160571.1 ROK family glucokinase [Nocardioides acrostichi]
MSEPEADSTGSVPADALTVGVDIGGTKILGGVVDADGAILAEHRVESPATDERAIEQAVCDLVRQLTRDHEVAGVGVGAAGYVDKSRSNVMFAPNIAWRDVTLRQDLESELGLPVVIENDANVAAWGEFRFGAGHDVDDLLLVTVGTGVGGGLVLDGELYRGAFGVGAEIGHMRVVPGGQLCGCGNYGCFEQYASGSALVREARTAARGGSLLARHVLDRADGDAEAITGPLITEAARDGDPFAVEQLATLGRWLGEGIASLTAVLDPAVAVIGGGVSEAGDLLLEPARQAFLGQLTGRGHRPALEIRKARLGNRAGLIGAADLARR